MYAHRTFAIAKRLALVGALGALAGCSNSSSSAPAAPSESQRNDVLDRLDTATTMLQEFRQKIPESVARRAQCVAIVPSLKKGGFIVGARAGKGFASCHTGTGWSPPAPISIGGGSFGAQIGFESADVLMLGMNESAKKSFLRGHFQIGADASATAGPVGTGRGASSDVNTNTDVVSYSRSSGLFAGAELSGANYEQDNDATTALYGKVTPIGTILGGSVPVPDETAARRFVTVVDEAFGAMRTSSR